MSPAIVPSINGEKVSIFTINILKQMESDPSLEAAINGASFVTNFVTKSSDGYSKDTSLISAHFCLPSLLGLVNPSPAAVDAAAEFVAQGAQIDRITLEKVKTLVEGQKFACVVRLCEAIQGSGCPSKIKLDLGSSPCLRNP